MEYLKKLSDSKKAEIAKAETQIANMQKGIETLTVEITLLDASIQKIENTPKLELEKERLTSENKKLMDLNESLLLKKKEPKKEVKP